MRGIICGKFLPFHLGHEALMRFASNFVYPYQLHIVVCSLPDDPINPDDRAIAIKKTFPDAVVHREKGVLPQFPEDDKNFWDIWKQVMNKHIPYIHKDDILFTSEEYGKEFSQVLKCKHVPFDEGRRYMPISGTKIRNNWVTNFKFINHEMQKLLRKEFVIIGPESAGKTTIVNQFKSNEYVDTTEEWARVYLEYVGADLTQDKLETICNGQIAFEKTSMDLSSKPYILRDTDVLTSLGWGRKYNSRTDALEKLERAVRRKKAIYLLKDPEGVPFVPDPQRYGLNKRETDLDYWKNLVQEFGVEYHHVNLYEDVFSIIF